MTRNRNQHVVLDGDKWAVKGANSKRVTKRHGTQKEAIQHGKKQFNTVGK